MACRLGQDGGAVFGKRAEIFSIAAARWRAQLCRVIDDLLLPLLCCPLSRQPLTPAPPEIVARLSAEIAKITRAPAFRERFDALGILPVGNTPDEALAFLKSEVSKWGKVIRDANVKVDN